MADKQWTMNCVLAGAAIQRLVDEKKIEEARRKLIELTFDLDAMTVDYLMNRIENKV